MPRKTDYHTMRINIDFNLYCQLKIRAFQSGLGIYELAKPEIDKFKQGLINLCTPAEVLKSESPMEESVEVKTNLESKPIDSAQSEIESMTNNTVAEINKEEQVATEPIPQEQVF